MTATDHGAFTEVDRLVDAIREQPEAVPRTIYVSYAALASALAQEVRWQTHAEPSFWSWSWSLLRMKRRPFRVEGAAAENLARFAEAQAERETALRALALAALDRLKEESVDSLADLLDRSVEELEESRQQASQVEGEREPDDPHEILKVLPAEYHEQFSSDYRDALRAAYPAEGYLALRRMLKRWQKAAEALSDQAYQAEAERSRQAAETGDFSRYTPMDDVFRDS
jgi:Family of unknown function (DUF6247)